MTLLYCISRACSRTCTCMAHACCCWCACSSGLPLLHLAGPGQTFLPPPPPPLPKIKNSYKTLTDRPTGISVPLATLGRPPGTPNAPRALFVFGEHCREIITTEVGLWLGRLLIDDHGNVRGWPELHAALERSGERAGAGGWAQTVQRWVDELLGSMTIQIVPIESLEGRRMVEGGAMCMRKTADTDVDLNRNWPFAWQKAVGARRCDEQGLGCFAAATIGCSLSPQLGHTCFLLATKTSLSPTPRAHTHTSQRPNSTHRAATTELAARVQRAVWWSDAPQRAPVAPAEGGDRRAPHGGLPERAQRGVGPVHALGLQAGLCAWAAGGCRCVCGGVLVL